MAALLAKKGLSYPQLAAAGYTAADYLKQTDDAQPFAAGRSLTNNDRQRLSDSAAQVLGTGITPQTGAAVWRQQFGYDANGNRTQLSDGWGSLEYSYDSADRLMRAGNRIYRHDANGNLLGESVWAATAAYSYNGDNRLTGVTLSHSGAAGLATGELTLSYRYDPLGRRMERNDSGGATRYHYLGLSMQQTGRRGEDGTESRYHYNGYRPVAESTDGVINYYGLNAAGSVIYASGADSRRRYDAFGIEYSGALTRPEQRGFGGKPLEPATGLYNFGCRDYNPQLGRFTTVDPVRDGINWYVYTSNDPVNYVDRWGLLQENDGGGWRFYHDNGQAPMGPMPEPRGGGPPGEPAHGRNTSANSGNHAYSGAAANATDYIGLTVKLYTLHDRHKGKSR